MCRLGRTTMPPEKEILMSKSPEKYWEYKEYLPGKEYKYYVTGQGTYHKMIWVSFVDWFSGLPLQNKERYFFGGNAVNTEKIVNKIRDTDPGNTKAGVYYEDIDILFRLAFAEKDKEKRLFLDNLIHLCSLLSDIEILKNENSSAAEYTIGLKVKEFKDLREKTLGVTKENKNEILFDPNKHELIQDTFFQ